MKTGVAVIGAGFMGRTHALSYGKSGMEARVLAVVDSNLTRAESLAASLGPAATGLTDVQAVLDDHSIEIVDICLPTDYHRDLCLRSLKAGKHVLCEKPIAPSLTQADEMIAAEKASRSCFMIAHVLRFWPEYVEAARIVKEGGIGKLRRISCQRLSTPPAWSAGNWLLDPKLSGGAVRDLAIHDFDFTNQLAGMPERVFASGNIMDFSACLTLADGVSATIQASYSMPGGFPFRMAFRLVGETGSVEFDGGGGKLAVVHNGELQSVSVSGEGLDGYFYEIAYFVDCVRNGRKPALGSSEDARDALAIALSVEEALA
jgi:predicted dehydrogenase